MAEASVVGPARSASGARRWWPSSSPRGAPPARRSSTRLCLEHIARFKRPKEYRFVERLPKNNYGKVVKTELRELAPQARAADYDGRCSSPASAASACAPNGIDINAVVGPQRDGARAPPAARLSADARDLAQGRAAARASASTWSRPTCAATAIRPSPPASRDHEPYSKRAMARGPGRGDARARPRALPPRAATTAARASRTASRSTIRDAVDEARGRSTSRPRSRCTSRPTEAFARAYWHWFFLILPAPLPERMIGADPKLLPAREDGPRAAGATLFAPEAWAEYERCFTPGRDPRELRGLPRRGRHRPRARPRRPRRRAASVTRAAARAVGRAWHHRALLRARSTNGAAWPTMCAATRCRAGHYIPEEVPGRSSLPKLESVLSAEGKRDEDAIASRSSPATASARKWFPKASACSKPRAASSASRSRGTRSRGAASTTRSTAR